MTALMLDLGASSLIKNETPPSRESLTPQPRKAGFPFHSIKLRGMRSLVWFKKVTRLAEILFL